MKLFIIGLLLALSATTPICKDSDCYEDHKWKTETKFNIQHAGDKTYMFVMKIEKCEVCNRWADSSIHKTDESIDFIIYNK